MYISKSGTSLNAIYNVDSKGRPETLARSSVQGVALSEGKKQAVSNSKFFEAGASMSLLKHPGKVGDIFDQHALQLARLLEHGLSEQSPAGGLPVYFKGRNQSLRDVLLEAIEPLSTRSDQIGRQMNTDQELQPWLLNTLNSPLQGQSGVAREQNHVEFLTKIRALSAFGDTVWRLMNPVDDPRKPELYTKRKEANAEVCMALLRDAGFTDQADTFIGRFKEFSTKTRTPCFDNPLSRARSERMPMVQVGGQLQLVNGKYEDASKFGLGFGQVVQNTFNPESSEQVALRTALGERNENINAITRQGAPIVDLTRPFTMSELDMENVPQAYSQQGFNGMLEQFSMLHGNGINRWQPFGTFTLESNQLGLPSAGGPSGGVCDILLALNTLNAKPIYGDPQLVLPAGLGIAAFMNFGGYHTFAETFPIAEAVAANRPYVPTNLAATNQKDLYKRIEDAAYGASDQGSRQIACFRQIHNQVQEQLRHQHPDLQSPGFEIDVFGTDKQIADWSN